MRSKQRIKMNNNSHLRIFLNVHLLEIKNPYNPTLLLNRIDFVDHEALLASHRYDPVILFYVDLVCQFFNFLIKYEYRLFTFKCIVDSSSFLIYINYLLSKTE